MRTSGVNQTDQREGNLSLIIRLLHRNSESTRVSLAQQTGLTQAAVGKLIAQLIDWGLVSEQQSLLTTVGRRPVCLVLNSGSYRCLALRINRDYIHGAVYDIGGVQYGTAAETLSPSEAPQTVMDKVLQMAEKLIAGSEVPPMCIGVAVPGPYNYVTGRLTLMSGVPGWEHISIRDALEERFPLPVFVEHDANCGALAETWYGGYPADCNMLYIVADRGIGAGFIINGTIYRGSHGFAGEIGHTSINIFGPRCECGNVGCLELYGSTIAMQNAYNQQRGSAQYIAPAAGAVGTDEILRLVRAGDPLACGVYRQTVSYLAFGAVSVINAFDPRTVVFSDRIIDGGPLFLETVRQTLQTYLMPDTYASLEIKTSSLGGDPMLFGASAVAFDHLLQAPSNYFKKT